MAHRFALRVYYEDTDLAGIVYYANYLKFIERGRSEALRDCGVDQRGLMAQGLVFAVRRVVADYLSPARFGDDLVVETRTLHLGGARLVLDQRVLRGAAVLFSAEVTLACLTDRGRAGRIPADIRHKMQAGAVFTQE